MQHRLALVNASDIGPLPTTMNSEVAAIVHSVSIDPNSKSYRRNLSSQFRELFEKHDWQNDTDLYFEEASSDTPHYLKNRVLVQVS